MAKGKKPYKTLRNFIISLIILVLLALLLPFFLKGPDKQALISPEKVKLPKIKLIKKQPADDRQIPIQKDAKVPKKKNTIYKWKDKHGVIHYTDYPNPNGSYEEISGVPEGSSSQATQSAPKDLDSDTQSTQPFPTTLSPSQIKKLKEDAQKIRETLQQRYDDMSQVQDE